MCRRLLVVPRLGGLNSGVLVFTLAPEAEGHGTDSVIRAYHGRQGQIRPRVPLVKIFADAVTIGTGGSGGREGPIAQIGAGFGSLLGNSAATAACGAPCADGGWDGSGIAAIFRAPLAGTMFAAEVLYRSPEFESEVIIPAGFASVVSYCIFGAYSGWEPLFTIPDLAFTIRGSWGRTCLWLFGHPERHDAGCWCERRVVADRCLGQDPHDWTDHRQRRIGRCIRAVDGHRRLWRRRTGHSAS